MVYVVARPTGRYELRRSSATPSGPRSETLVGFREMTPDVARRAVARSGGSLTEEEVREAAYRAGAPVQPDGARSSAARLIGELAGGATLPSRWESALREMLDDGEDAAAAERIGMWGDASPERRGAALHDLLLLADALPKRARSADLAFPGFQTAPR